jgi:hypothetical protein
MSNYDPSQSPNNIAFGDTMSVDAFGRARVGSPFGLFDNKNVYGKNITLWQERLDATGTGSSIDAVSAESSVLLTCGTDANAFAIRQTTRYFTYVPGKSQRIDCTGVLNPDGETTNVIRRIGYFDNDNGVFFELNGSTLSTVIRNNGVDNPISKTDWKPGNCSNVIKSIDPTQAQIFTIDFQWLGVGRVRYAFNVNGKEYKAHEVNHANISTAVYMETPTLPVRYEIRNTGARSAVSTLKEICCSVSSEGGYRPPGLEHSADMFITPRNVTTTLTPFFAIGLLDSFGGKDNRVTAQLLFQTYDTTADVIFRVAHVHNPVFTGETRTAVGGGSAMESMTGMTSVAGDVVHFIQPRYLASGIGSASGSAAEPSKEYISEHSFLSQNFESDNSQAMVFYAAALTGTADVLMGTSWIEIF